LAFTIVRVASGGLPVVESERGLPYYEADNGYGIPVTFGSTGIPLGTVGSTIYNFATGTYPSGFSNVNSTGGNVFSSAGLMSSVAANTLRIGSGNGLYVMPAFTNLGFPSEQNASFFSSSTNCTIANSATVGPDGASTTFYSTATSTVANGARQKNTTVANDGGTYRASIFVASKSGGQTVRWQAGLVGGTGINVILEFNITTGAITANASGTGTVQAVSGGWRVSVQITNNSTGNTTLFCQLYPVAGGTGSADFGGWSLVKQSLLADYLKTISGTVAQSSDVVTRTTGADLAAATGRVTISARTPIGAGTQVLWQRDDGTANNRFTIYRDSSRFIHFVIVAGGVTYSDRAPSIIADNTAFTVSMAWSGSLASYTINGGIPFLEAEVTLPTGITTERLGSDTGGNQWGSFIGSLTTSISPGISTPTFYESFNRANTSAGVMSDPPVGAAYAFYGPYVDQYPLPPASNGYISGDAYAQDQNNTSYLEQNMGRALSSGSAKLSWASAGGSTGAATAAFLIYNVAGTIDDCIHIQVRRANALIEKRVDGVIQTLATVTYAAGTIATDGQYTDVSIAISGSTVTLTVNGNTNQATDAFFATVDGNFICFENAMQDAVDAVKFHAIGAS
jgi:hypothetical protein